MNAMWCGIEAGTLVSHKPSGRIAHVGTDEASVPTVPLNQIPIRFIDQPNETTTVSVAEVECLDQLY